MMRQAGFTLIEMLVALAVFGFLATASAALLGGGMASRDAVAQSGDRLAELEAARAILKADLAQIALRAGRDASGENRPWRFSGRDPGLAGAGPVLAFTRRGWSNPEDVEARSGLLFIEYIVEDGELVRLAHHRPDLAPGTPVTRRTLLSDIDGPRLRFLGADRQWRPEWQVPRRGGTLPLAVELTLATPGLGTVRQVFTAGDD